MYLQEPVACQQRHSVCHQGGKNVGQPDVKVDGDCIDCVPLQEKPKSPKAQVNAVFFHRLRQLLKIGIPGILSPEFGCVLLVAISLVGRTLCDLWLIQKTTLIETYVQCS